MRCPRLWSIVNSIVNTPLCLAADRLGVGQQSCLDGVIVAHNIYHFVKMDRRDEVERLQSMRQLRVLLESAYRYGAASFRDLN